MLNAITERLVKFDEDLKERKKLLPGLKENGKDKEFRQRKEGSSSRVLDSLEELIDTVAQKLKKTRKETCRKKYF